MRDSYLKHCWLSLFVIIIIHISGCGVSKNTSRINDLNEYANSQNIIMKGYQPIDPVSVKLNDTLSKADLKRILIKLPNDAARIAIGSVNQSGSLVFSPVSVARKGKSYTVIVDYVKYINTTIPASYSYSRKIFSEEEAKEKLLVSTIRALSMTPWSLKDKTKEYSVTVLKQELSTNYGTINSTNTSITYDILNASDNEYSHEIRVPVYIGVGLRVHASFTVLSDSVNIGSLFGLGVAASQNKIVGTMVTQTLGVSGKDISQLMPISDEINQSTIQDAIQAIATMKSKLYDDSTDINPQVIGFSLPYSLEGAKDLIESTIHSESPNLVLNTKGNISFQEISFLKSNQ